MTPQQSLENIGSDDSPTTSDSDQNPNESRLTAGAWLIPGEISYINASVGGRAPLTPRAPDFMSSLYRHLNSIHGISTVTVRDDQSHRYNVTDICTYQCTISGSESAQTVIDRIQSTLGSLFPGGITGAITAHDSSLVEVTPIRHPLLPQLYALIEELPDHYRTSIWWPHTFSSPPSSVSNVFTADWDTIPPLSVAIYTTNTCSNRHDLLTPITERFYQRLISDTQPAIYVDPQTPQELLQASSYESLETHTKHLINTRDQPTLAGIDPLPDGLPLGVYQFQLRHDTSHFTQTVNASGEQFDDVLDDVTDTFPTSHDLSRNLSQRTDHSQIEDSNEPIQLTITSPPYLDAIDYNAYTDTEYQADWKAAATTPADPDAALNTWKSMQRDIFTTIYDCTKPGGYCAVVVSPVIPQDATHHRLIDLPSHLSSLLTDIGWTFDTKIIWAKTTGGSNRFGTTIQNDRPDNVYLNQMHESILVFHKGKRMKQPRADESLVFSDLMTKDVANNVWHIDPVPPNKQSVDHPAPFPDEIPYRLITLFSRPHDVIADPMMGSGTTLKVARALDRIAIGTDINPKFVAEARQRIQHPPDRGNQVIPEWKEWLHPPSDGTTTLREPSDSPQKYSQSTQQSLSQFNK